MSMSVAKGSPLMYRSTHWWEKTVNTEWNDPEQVTPEQRDKEYLDAFRMDYAT